MDKSGGTDADVKTRIGKARSAFNMLKKVWSSREIGTSTKVRLFNSNVKSVLLYGAETWRTTKASMKKIQTFINQCLRRILRIHWPETISNENLWARMQQTQWKRTSDEGDGAGLAIRYANHLVVLAVKP